MTNQFQIILFSKRDKFNTIEENKPKERGHSSRKTHNACNCN